MAADAMSLGQAQTRLVAAYADFVKKLSSAIGAAFDMAKNPTRAAELMKICDSLAPGTPAQMVMPCMVFAAATGDEAAPESEAKFDALEQEAKSAAADVLEAAKAVLQCDRPSVREETYYYPELASWIHDRTSLLPPRVTCPVCLASHVSVPPLDDIAAAAAAGTADGDRQGGYDKGEAPEKGVLLSCNNIVCDGCWNLISQSSWRGRRRGKCPVCRAQVEEIKDLNERLEKESKILGSAP